MIEIQVSVDDILNEPAYVPAIESLGVQLRSRDSDHRFFRPFADRRRVIRALDARAETWACGTGWSHQATGC